MRLKKIIFLVTLSVLAVIGISFLISHISYALEEDEVISLYAQDCQGDWKYTENILGAPSVSDKGTIEMFSDQNSAIYKGGDSSVVCKGFLPEIEEEEVTEKPTENGSVEDTTEEDTEGTDTDAAEEEATESTEEDGDKEDTTEEGTIEEDNEVTNAEDSTEEETTEEPTEEDNEGTGAEEPTGGEAEEDVADGEITEEEAADDEGPSKKEEEVSAWERVKESVPVLSREAQREVMFRELREKDFRGATINFSFSLGEKEQDLFIETEENENEPTSEKTSGIKGRVLDLTNVFWGAVKSAFGGIQRVFAETSEDEVKEEDTAVEESLEGETEEGAVVGDELGDEEESVGVTEGEVADGDTTEEDTEGTDTEDSVEEETEEDVVDGDTIEGEADEDAAEEEVTESTEDSAEGETDEDVADGEATEGEADEDAAEEEVTESTEDSAEGETDEDVADGEATEEEITEETPEEDTEGSAEEEADEDVTESTEEDSDKEDTPKEPTVTPTPETKMVISYTTDGVNWYVLDTLEGESISNGINDGYFSYGAHFLDNWDDVENLEIKVEGVTGGETVFTAYLDSVWVDVNYTDFEVEEEITITTTKEHYRADETPEFVIKPKKPESLIEGAKNLFGKDVEVKNILLSSSGKRVSLSERSKGVSVSRNSPINIKLEDISSFGPGKHKIQVEVEWKGETYTLEQDFTWGVLALNVNKSIYTSSDSEVYIQMGVLDDYGRTICNADLEMVITSPEKEEKYLSTIDKTIHQSGECAGDSYVEVPDYFAYYKELKEPGTYDIQLTAHTRNGERTVTDSFELRDNVPYDIERTGPTRIYPPADYEVMLKIKANSDFKGEITERVPRSFKIKKDSSFKIEDVENEKKIVWESVNLKKGEILTLSYTFNAPDVSPEFYLLGPLTLDSEEDSFGEIRKWQVAGDSVINISGTVYTDKGVATSTAGSLIHLAVNGVSIATTTASTTTGVYEFEGVTPPSAGDPVTVFVDDTSESGANVTLYEDGGMTDLDIYTDYVNLTHQGTTSISNEDIAHFDSTDNSSIPFSVSAGPTFLLEVDSGHTLLVMSGKTYEPANSLETPNLTIDGTVNAGSNLLSITGSSTPFVINGTFNEQTSTVSYENTTSANITDTTYYNLQTDPLSGTPTYTFLGSSTTTNSFTINDGEVVAPTYFTVGGNWTNSGTFTHNSGTVELNTTATTTVTGSNTFYKFVSTEGGKTIKFAAGSTQTVASGGTLELVGGGCDALITLRSTSDGNQWNIDVEGATTVTVDYVDVDDSNATGGEITATNSLGGVANNTNWDIDGGDCIVTVNITAADYNNLELYPSDGVIYILGTSSGQSITTTGYMEIGNGTDDGSVTAADHNPSIEVGTDFIISANATFRASASALFSVAQDWSNSGSFIHNSGTVSFVDSVKTSVISGATTFYNFTSTAAGKTLRFTAGVVQTFAGTFTVTGADGNLVNIESSASGTQWLPYFVNPQGTHESPTVTYASIKDSGGDSGSESIYLDTTSEEGSNVNTSYWIWPSFDEGIDISGTVYTDKGVTASTEGSIINLAIDGVSIATTTASTTTGIYEFEGITQPTAGNPITVFIDDASESGATITLYNSGDVTGLDIYTDYVNLRHENLGPLTNTNIGHYATSTPFTVSAGNLSLSSGHKLMVWSDKTFTPGGNVTLSPSSTSSDVGGDLEIVSGATLSMGTDSLSVGGNYLNSGTFSASAGQTTTFTATASGHTIVDGGSGFKDVVFNGVSGGWLYKDGASSAPDSTTVENGEANFVNAKTGTVTVNGGTLLVDWYLGVHTVDKNNTDSDIETGSGDIAVSENSETPASVIFRHDGANWGIASSTQTTESSLSGINPQPELNGAVRIREYEMTSSATTTYLYNLQVEAQAGYTFYDFYEDHGGEYLTSSLSATGTKTISDNWWRENSGTVNGNKPYSGLNMSPDSGTWYVGLAGDIQFSVDEASVGLGALNEMNVWTATGTTMLMATTSYSGGYIVRAYANNDGRLKLGEEEEYIDRWPHDNSTPAFWTGTCDNDGECGFGHTTDSTTLGSECNEDRFLGATKYAGFATSSVNAVEVSRNCIAVPSGESTNIIYRLSAPRASVPGIYSGTIYYIANVNY